jgi:hypothetical protein
MTAVMGEAVAIENPADAPPVITYLRQPLCFSELKHFTTPSPIAVPICTQGPSVPSGMPQKKVSKAEMGSAMRLVSHLKLTIPRIATIEDGIPPPLQLCVCDRIILAISPIAAVPTTRRGSKIGSERTWPYITDDILTTHSAANLNAVTIMADKKPVVMEKARQGIIRFFR